MTHLVPLDGTTRNDRWQRWLAEFLNIHGLTMEEFTSSVRSKYVREYFWAGLTPREAYDEMQDAE